MIRQFDVVPNPLRLGRDERPFLVVIQHDRISELSTRVVAPLVVKQVVAQESRLSPSVTVQGRKYFFDPTNIATLPLHRLGQAIANLDHERERIVAALDLAFTGV